MGLARAAAQAHQLKFDGDFFGEDDIFDCLDEEERGELREILEQETRPAGGGGPLQDAQDQAEALGVTVCDTGPGRPAAAGRTTPAGKSESDPMY